MSKITFNKIHHDAKLPTNENIEGIGYDLYCTSVINKHKYVEYHTGISVNLPEGIFAILTPVDSICDKDLILKNSMKIITHLSKDEIIFNFNDTKEYSAVQKKERYVVGDCIGRILFFTESQVVMLKNI